MSFILSLPLEIFEKVVGDVSFVDLPHFLQTSKQIKVFKTTLVTIPRFNSSQSAFQATRYHRRLAVIPPEVLKGVYEVFENQPNSWSHWSTHNILSSLSSPYCEHVSILFASWLIITQPNCENFGQHFLWCSVPALRLCAVCVQLPRYKFIRVRDALATYGLKRGAVASLPKLKSTHIINYRLTYYMQVLRAIFQAEHQSFVTICSSQLPNRTNYLIFQFSLLIISIVITHLARNKSSMNPQCLSFNPIAYLSRTFEPKAGGFIEGLICGHCKEDPEFIQRYRVKRSRWVS